MVDKGSSSVLQGFIELTRDPPSSKLLAANIVPTSAAADAGEAAAVWTRLKAWK